MNTPTVRLNDLRTRSAFACYCAKEPRFMLAAIVVKHLNNFEPVRQMDWVRAHQYRHQVAIKAKPRHRSSMSSPCRAVTLGPIGIVLVNIRRIQGWLDEIVLSRNSTIQNADRDRIGARTFKSVGKSPNPRNLLGVPYAEKQRWGVLCDAYLGNGSRVDDTTSEVSPCAEGEDDFPLGELNTLLRDSYPETLCGVLERGALTLSNPYFPPKGVLTARKKL